MDKRMEINITMKNKILANFENIYYFTIYILYISIKIV